MRTIWATVLVLAVAVQTSCSDGGETDTATASPSVPSRPGCSGCAVVDPAAAFGVLIEAENVVVWSAASGSGSGKLEINRSNGALSGMISLAGLDASDVTVNAGYAGEVGPVLLRFEPRSGGGWSLPPTARLRPADIELLDTGGLYVNVVTVESPEGAARGQIVSADSVSVSRYTLFGSQVVPAVQSDVTGRLYLTVSDSHVVSSDSVVELHVNLRGLAGISAVHVHQGSVGANGPVVADLVQDTTDPDHWFTHRSLLDEAAISGLATLRCDTCHPVLYVDVHTEAHPAGELRAQLAHRTQIHFSSISSTDVVGETPAAQGTGVIAATLTDIVGWDWIPEYRINVHLQGVSDVTDVTLNYAPVGQNGPVAYLLERSASGDRWVGTALLDEQKYDTGNGYGWYINVATAENPGGAVRGQLATQFVDSEPAGFGVTSVRPADGGTFADWPSAVEVRFSEAVHSFDAGRAFDLLASGGDGSFVEGNEIEIVPSSVIIDGTTMRVSLDPMPSAEDVYRIRLEALYDEEGNGIGRFVSTFAVDPAHPSPTLAELQQDLFTPSCAQGGCHSGTRPAVGLDLSSGATLDSLVNVPSVRNPDLDLVEPGDSTSSQIVRTLFRSSWDPHPAGQAQLTNASLQRLRQWIDEGAPEN